MAVHEFGLMESPPIHGRRYDEYEPARYACIAVCDDDLDCHLQSLCAIPCFAHTLDCPMMGLAWCGITLIPPQSAREMAELLRSDPSLCALTDLCSRAADQQKYIIHFGL